MDPFGDEQAAGQYMLDAINEDTRATPPSQSLKKMLGQLIRSWICLEMPMKKMMMLRRRPINSSMFQYES